MADNKAKLTIAETSVDLDVLSPTLGSKVIDIRTLGSKGYYTYDPGFTSTASCESKITFIDGDNGILLHRGFPIGQLATESTYLEVCSIHCAFKYWVNDILFTWCCKHHMQEVTCIGEVISWINERLTNRVFVTHRCHCWHF